MLAMSGVPLRSVLFNILINYIDRGDQVHQKEIRKSGDNTKLSGAVATSEGQDVIQRDLDKWEWEFHEV